MNIWSTGHAAALSVTLGISLACAQAPASPQFDAASVKPNTSGERFIRMRPPVGGAFNATNVTLRALASVAYRVKDFAIVGGPEWARSERFDIAAKAADTSASDEQFRLMLQHLLADRFQLAVHEESRSMPIYALTPAKSGMHLPGANPEGCTLTGQKVQGPPCGPFGMDSGDITRVEGDHQSMAALASALSSLLGRPVQDETAYTGSFNVHLEFATPDNANKELAAPSVFTALEEQLGLKLESKKAQSEVLIIDRAERPSEN